MITRDLLNNLLHSYNLLNPIEKIAIDESYKSTSLIDLKQIASEDKLMEFERIYSLKQLKNILNNLKSSLNSEISHSELEPLKKFLAIRWERIKDTYLDYLHPENNVMNQLCKQIAEVVAAIEDKKTSLILMPPHVQNSKYSLLDSKLINNEKRDLNSILEKDTKKLLRERLCLNKGAIALAVEEEEKTGEFSATLLAFDFKDIKTKRWSIAHLAAIRGNVPLMKMIAEEKFVDLNKRDAENWTVADRAAFYNHAGIIKIIAEYQFEINPVDAAGLTPAHIAAQQGHVDVLKILAEYKVDLNQSDLKGMTPLHHAIQYSKLNVVKELALYKNIDLNKENKKGNIPLHYAIKLEKWGMVAALLMAPQQLLEDKWTSQEIAKLIIKKGDVASFKVLLENTDFDTTISSIKKLIAFAIEKQNILILNLLCSVERIAAALKINLTEIKNKNLTIAHLAVLQGDEELLKLILQKSILENRLADIDCPDSKGETPLILAIKQKQWKIAATILLAPTPLSRETYTASDIAFLAVKNNNLKVIEQLHTQKMDFSCNAPAFYQSPLDYAIENNKIQVITSILSQPETIAATLNMNIDSIKSMKYTLGHVLAIKNHPKLLKIVSENKLADLNAFDRKQWTIADHAASLGHEKIIQVLADCKVNINQADAKGYTPAHLAAENGHANVIKTLSENKVDLNQATDKGNTPAHKAVSKGQLQVIKALSSCRGIDFNKKNNNGDSPLALALEKQYWEIVAIILSITNSVIIEKSGEHISHFLVKHLDGAKAIQALSELKIDWSTKNKDGKSAIQVAMERSDTNIVSLLADQKADFTLEDSTGITPLHFAVKHGMQEIINALAMKNVNFAIKNSQGVSPKVFAIKTKKWNIVDSLYELNSAEATQKKWNSLQKAVAKGDEELVRLFAENESFDLAKTDITAQTPLEIAISHGHIGVIKILVEFGADLNQLNVGKLSPAHLAVEYNKPEVVKTLLECKANFNLGTLEGNTPAHIAVQKGRVEIIKELLEHKEIDFTRQNMMGKSPLSHAISENNWKLAGIILQSSRNADPNKNWSREEIAYLAYRNNHMDALQALKSKVYLLKMITPDKKPLLIEAIENKQTPVIAFLLNVDSKQAEERKWSPGYMAAMKGDTDALSMLHEAKYDLNSVDQQGSTAAHIAVQYGQVRALKILENANVNFAKADNEGYLPMHYAARDGQAEILKTLAKHDIDLHKSTKSNDTLASLAILNKKTQVIQVLAENKYDFNKPGYLNQTALALALEKQAWGMVALMLLSMSNDIVLKPEERKTLMNNRVLLRNAILEIVTSMTSAEKQTITSALLDGNNILHTIFKTPTSKLKQIFSSGDTEDMKIIKKALVTGGEYKAHRAEDFSSPNWRA